MEDYDFLFLRKAVNKLKKIRREMKKDLRKRKVRKNILRRRIRKLIK